ncbi:hypothetical protein [Planobispora longispora]|uniref:Uncharacterized protein n=1 Tax=Planobispora longispora TaxID=28887 RepID=A0A8J3W7S3_9ACTN|nr:hypothetical protein [Planobispora longispora]BFE84341.1 hypothetical protein GCM10020093_069420 [Planobispora longispora]GIH79097.1 hypothetical protein Plo01_55260 [Planobispora longispora]
MVRGRSRNDRCRTAANHLTGALSLITRIADGRSPDPAEVDATPFAALLGYLGRQP